MTAVGLFDVLSKTSDSGHRDSGGGLERLATALVKASLADHQRILQYEADFSPQNWNDAAQSLLLERSIYSLHEQWATEATEIMSRVRQLVATGATIPELQDLERALRRTRAQLEIKPEQVARAINDIKDGNTIPAKELRDELRARLRY